MNSGDSIDRRAKTANALATVGFAPFALCAIIILANSRESALSLQALEAMRAYSISILSFLGGIRWGAAIDSERAGRAFLHSVVPALIAWATVFMTPLFALSILAMAFAAQGAWDVFSAQNALLPRWYGHIRIKLTLMVVAALLTALFAVG